MRNIKRNKIILYLPFKGQWFVFWGGDNKKLNIHHGALNQKFAFDLGIVDKNGKSYDENGQKNEDYYCYEKDILAPAGGEVIGVIDGVRDNDPGLMNPYSAVGNAVFIQHNRQEISVLAHLRPRSIKVKVGDKVKTEQIIGLCGNSGNSSEPHLHYHLQDDPIIQQGKGIKCFFQRVIVMKNGKSALKNMYSPIKGEIISPG